jgi:hypothetical protein
MIANAAREIVEQIGDHTDVTTAQEELALGRGLTRDGMLRPLKTIANFLKHADRDPAATIDIDHSDVEVVLQLACHDFGRIAGGMPIEAQVFEAWVYAVAFDDPAKAPADRREDIKRAIKGFPGISSAPDRTAQKKIGLEVLTSAEHDPLLRMKINREVTLPERRS